MQWYYADESDNQIGPVDETAIKALITEGKIKRGQLVWNDTLPDWVAVEKTDLAASLSASTPPRLPKSAASSSVADSFDRDDTKIFPSNPPKSPNLSWLNLLGPGLAQIIYGKIWMGVAGICISGLLNYMMLASPSAFIMTLGLIVASIVDGYMTANQLQRGRPVGKWEFFPHQKA